MASTENQNEEEMNATTLAQAALSIYAEQVVSQAVNQQQQSRSENAALQASRDLLLKVQVALGREVLWEGSVLDCQDDDDDVVEGVASAIFGGTMNVEDDYFVLSVDANDAAAPPPFSLDDIHQLSCTSFGFSSHADELSVFMQRGMWGLSQFSTVKEDGTVELRLQMNPRCVVVGLLENFAGTVSDMKEMIEHNRLCMYLSQLGMINVATGEPVQQFVDPVVQGATFRVTKIKLAKTAVQPILDQEETAAQLATIDENVKELKKLCETFAINGKLRKTMEEQTAVLKENIMLKASRDTVRSVQARFGPGDEHDHDDAFVEVYLDQGRRAKFDDEHESPSWLVNVPSDQGRISLMDICKIQISLSGFPLARSGWYAMQTQMAQDASLIKLPYNSEVDAFFVLDRSWENFDFETVPSEYGFVNWLRIQFGRGSNEAMENNVPMMTMENNVPVYDGPEVFLKLVFFNFRLGLVSQSLNALGIDYSPANKDGENESSGGNHHHDGEEDGNGDDSGEE